MQTPPSPDRLSNIPPVRNLAALVWQNVDRFGDKPAMRSGRAGDWVEITWNTDFRAALTVTAA